MLDIISNIWLTVHAPNGKLFHDFIDIHALERILAILAAYAKSLANCKLQKADFKIDL